MITDKQKET